LEYQAKPAEAAGDGANQHFQHGTFDGTFIADPWHHNAPQVAKVRSKVPVPVLRQQMEYHSSTHRQWIPCSVTHVDESAGAIMVDVKPGAWIQWEFAGSSFRAAQPLDAAQPLRATSGPPAPVAPIAPSALAVPSSLNNVANNQVLPALTHRNALTNAINQQPADVVQESHQWFRDHISGSGITSVVQESHQRFRNHNNVTHDNAVLGYEPNQQAAAIAQPQPPLPSSRTDLLRPVQQMEYKTDSGAWVACAVDQVDLSSGAMMVNVLPGVWLTLEQQAQCIRLPGLSL